MKKILSQGTAASLVSGDQETAIVLYTVMKVADDAEFFFNIFLLYTVLWCIPSLYTIIWYLYFFLVFFIYCKIILQ